MSRNYKERYTYLPKWFNSLYTQSYHFASRYCTWKRFSTYGGRGRAWTTSTNNSWSYRLRMKNCGRITSRSARWRNSSMRIDEWRLKFSKFTWTTPLTIYIRKEILRITFHSKILTSLSRRNRVSLINMSIIKVLACLHRILLSPSWRAAVQKRYLKQSLVSSPYPSSIPIRLAETIDSTTQSPIKWSSLTHYLPTN